MDHWGALQSLNRKQQAEKRRKAEIRAIYTQKKKSYLNIKKSKDEFNFPELSSEDLAIIKKQVRTKVIRMRVLNFIWSSLIFTSIVAVLIYFFFFYK